MIKNNIYYIYNIYFIHIYSSPKICMESQKT